MHLSEALHRMPPETLASLASELIKDPSNVAQLSSFIVENELKTFLTVNKIILTCLPPTFSILRVLIENEHHEYAADQLREVALRDMQEIVDGIRSGHLIGRDDNLHIYRQVLIEARRSEMIIDASESALLEVLRRELIIGQAEHFLLEHHPDFKRFWISAEQSYQPQLQTLMRKGILYEFEGRITLPKDLAPIVADCIGYQLSRTRCAELYELLTVKTFSEVGESLGISLGGSKEERIKKLCDNMVEPRLVLSYLNSEELKDLCGEYKTSSVGTKDEKIDRLLSVLKRPPGSETIEETERPPVEEVRMLGEQRFFWLFSKLRGLQMRSILESIPHAKRSTGTKELLAHKLWEIKLSEETLLNKLTNDELADLLQQIDLRATGSKSEKINRLVAHAQTMSDEKILAEVTIAEKSPSSVD